MSSPSFLVRLRTRSRRQDSDVSLQLPEDHWHAGDPRLTDGSLALQHAQPHPAAAVPGPRRALVAVPEVDVRDGVVDLRWAHTPPGLSAAEAAARAEAARPRTAPMPAVAPAAAPAAPEQPWNEPSTWLG